MAGRHSALLQRRNVIKFVGTPHVNPVLSVVVVDVVVGVVVFASANQKGTFNTKTIKRTTSSSSTSHDPNGNYLGLVGWLVVGSNDAAAAFTLSDGGTRGSIIAVKLLKLIFISAPKLPIIMGAH